MSNRPFEPMERDAAAKIESILEELTKDCEELTAESPLDHKIGVQQGISKVRELSDALESLKTLVSGR
jgi:hypothetical protein